MTLLAERPPDEVDESELVVGRRIQEFSQLAGPIREPDPAEGAYRVAYRGVDAVHGRGRVARSLLVAGLNFAFEALFFLWLLHPSHRPPVFGSTFAIYANWIVIGSIGLMELLRLINVLLAVAGLGDLPRPGARAPAARPAHRLPHDDRARARNRSTSCAGRCRRRCASSTTGSSTSGSSTRATTRTSRRCAASWASTTSPARGSRSTTSARARSRPRPSTATTTPGWPSTATRTRSSSRSTRTTCRCPTTPSGSSATSATRTSPTSSARSATPTTRRS